MAGLDPGSLLELDGPTFDAVEVAALERAAWLDELAALNVEYLHLAYIAYLATHGVKGQLEPLELPRPHDTPAAQPAQAAALTPTDFALAFGPGPNGARGARG